jgi:hypothetical protein
MKPVWRRNLRSATGVGDSVIIPFVAGIRRTIAAGFAALMVCQSVAVPLLDRAERLGGPVLESEHSASSCVKGHDHTVCTQFSANHQIPSEAPRHSRTAREIATFSRESGEIAITRASHSTQHSRAPPSAPLG